MKILNGLIPETWTEIIEEYPECVGIRVLMGKDTLDDEEWKELLDTFDKEFPDKVMSVYEPYSAFKLTSKEEDSCVIHVKEFTLWLSKDYEQD